MQNEPVALLEAQLSQLRTEKHFLLNSVVQGQKKDDIIQILIEQLKNNAPRQYLVETAAQIRRTLLGQEEEDHHYHRDKDIDAVCRLLEAPIDLVLNSSVPLRGGAPSSPSTSSSNFLFRRADTSRLMSTSWCPCLVMASFSPVFRTNNSPRITTTPVTLSTIQSPSGNLVFTTTTTLSSTRGCFAYAHACIPRHCGRAIKSFGALYCLAERDGDESRELLSIAPGRQRP